MNSLVTYESSDSETDNDKSEEVKFLQRKDDFVHSKFQFQPVFPTSTGLESSQCGLELKVASTGSSNEEYNWHRTPNYAQRHFCVTPRPTEMSLNDETYFQFSKSNKKNALDLMQKSDRIPAKVEPSAQKRLFQDSVPAARNVKPYIPKRLRQKEEVTHESKDNTEVLNSGINQTAPEEQQLSLLSKISDFIKPYLKNQHKTSDIPKHSVFHISQHKGPVTTIQWCPVQQHSHLLLSASMDKTIKIWNAIETGRCLKTYLCHSGAVRDVQWSLCGRQILSGGFDSMLHLTDIETAKQIISVHNGCQITCLAFNPENQSVFLSGGFSSTVKAWDTRNSQIVNEYNAGIQQTLDILFLPGGKEFLTSTDAVSRDSADRTIIAWDFQTSAKISNQIFHERYTIPCLTVHPKESFFLAQTNGNYMVLFSTQRPYRMNKRKRYEGHKVEGYAVGCEFSPDGTLIATGSADGTVCFYNYLNSKLVYTLPAHKQACTNVSFHPVHPSILATCDWSGEIKVWQ
ncbi:WD repeat-containing protein 25 [Scyliorhinus canicula]|uniref:WD repeat-containing protein 25 n=1 Tax=Scyliorhinus canicula TaxID=7830 RepID=UPI0018F35B9D|nr:WD repeat-containing protein 25 [Scyliorhinus canicula]XP_038632785.1 WD repeat-containing protein 25 [Scyliorhinus canicula]XP_038632793.1 WD repeat-containing protein 25 [Scyliorhinus canicula]XP_038632803.1 WD repeat-containing protein 25 [Scyliorhinus canicula]XP_038632811.1 WD repeat-containing protein 25 [Scyliorhinus canicula]